MEVFAAFDFCRSHKNLFLFFTIVAISRKLTNTSKTLLNDWLRTHTCPSLIIKILFQCSIKMTSTLCLIRYNNRWNWQLPFRWKVNRHIHILCRWEHDCRHTQYICKELNHQVTNSWCIKCGSKKLIDVTLIFKRNEIIVVAVTLAFIDTVLSKRKFDLVRK